MALLLGIDIGTSGCKVLLVDERGRIVRQAAAEYPLSVPHPMWAEQDPEDWWRGLQSCLAQLGEFKADAIGLTGQMHGSVFLDKDLEVIRPALLWNDQRTVEECIEIETRIGREELMRVTCNPALTGFQAPKILWLRNHELSNYQRVRHVLLPKDFIRLRLTGELRTDVSDASGTGLFDVPARDWSHEILLGLDLAESFFPPSSESFSVSAATKDGVPVVGGGGDQAAAAVGTGTVKPGIVSVSLGTSGVIFTCIDGPKFDPLGAAHTFCHANGEWHAMGVMLNCGGALRWYRDTFAGDANYSEIGDEASRIAPGSGGVTFLPYLTGERCPHNDPFATGFFGGMTLGHSRANLSRAVFEGISFGLLDCLNLLKGLGAELSEIRVTSGGAKSRFWIQMLADVFGAPCTTLEIDEGPAFGAAILAGVGIGLWPNVSHACEQVVKVRDVTDPQGVEYGPAFERFRQLYPVTRNWKQ
jgi:xylulokinase